MLVPHVLAIVVLHSLRVQWTFHSRRTGLARRPANKLWLSQVRIGCEGFSYQVGSHRHETGFWHSINGRGMVLNCQRILGTRHRTDGYFSVGPDVILAEGLLIQELFLDAGTYKRAHTSYDFGTLDAEPYPHKMIHL